MATFIKGQIATYSLEPKSIIEINSAFDNIIDEQFYEFSKKELDNDIQQLNNKNKYTVKFDGGLLYCPMPRYIIEEIDRTKQITIELWFKPYIYSNYIINNNGSRAENVLFSLELSGSRGESGPAFTNHNDMLNLFYGNPTNNNLGGVRVVKSQTPIQDLIPGTNIDANKSYYCCFTIDNYSGGAIDNDNQYLDRHPFNFYLYNISDNQSTPLVIYSNNNTLGNDPFLLLNQDNINRNYVVVIGNTFRNISLDTKAPLNCEIYGLRLWKKTIRKENIESIIKDQNPVSQPNRYGINRDDLLLDLDLREINTKYMGDKSDRHLKFYAINNDMERTFESDTPQLIEGSLFDE